MTIKKSLLIAFLLLMAVSLISPINTASAEVPFLSFAGIGESTGLNWFTNNETAKKDAPEQFFNSAVVAMNVSLPNKKTAAKSVPKTYLVPSTAYSSTKDQTDDTPFITAMGTHVRDGVVAANFLPFGTVIKIPDHFGDKTFIVEDRMNRRYDYRIDLWFPTRAEAKEWGLKKIKIEIIS
ncbi:MAG: hypothetical protein A3C71_00455 [Candidatus Yanofskybacteria bacterium RIFCSPHIGHO2_02_FULL_43_15c]|uniref:3D domain-containing protein n=1 Tax=Candidatus Yanofskybacteria bacterium RIFCSPHIGHO2_02_FULL_43_15c TaxID=1802679 RepID=A0A1F8FKL0_9BACT|nr:MAG: hypothetical protein A3C71_00455 [Candidatus Yanofskybacteria bacterium RIFCSPHIGHO2_02_FULL_43_15c]